MADVRGASVRLVTPTHDSAMDDTADAARVLLVDADGAPISVLPVSGAVDTELPAAAALADNTANPTVPGVGAYGMLWDGATWDRAPGNTLGQFVQGNVASGAADSGNPVKVGGVYNTSPPALTNGQRGDLQLDASGNLAVLGSVSIRSSGGTVAVVDSSAGDAESNAFAGLVTYPRLFGFNGSTWDRLRSDTTNGLDVDPTRLPTGQGRTLVTVAIAQGAAGTTDLVAAAGGSLKIKVVSVVFTLDVAGTAKFTRHTGPTDITGAMAFAANGGMSAIGQPSSHLFETGANEKLSIVTTGGKAAGWLTYFTEA